LPSQEQGFGQLPAIRSWLYAPGNNARLLDRVMHVGADAVIFDLEDSVPLTEKSSARRVVAELLHQRVMARRPVVAVRINSLQREMSEEDVRAVACPALKALRVPKVEDPEQVRGLAELVAKAETDAGMEQGSIGIVLGIESASGVENAAELAVSSRRIITLSFGAADFAADIGASVGDDQAETLYARSRIVTACRRAGLRSPIDSAYTRLGDDAGLERSTRAGRALGFFGRSCIHPRQVPIVNEVFTPSSAEVEAARVIVHAAAEAEQAGRGAIRLEDGRFVDAAIVRRAELVLRTAAALASESVGVG